MVVVVSPCVMYEALVVTTREAVQLLVNHATDSIHKPTQMPENNLLHLITVICFVPRI